MKLGKLSPAEDPRTLKLSKYMAAPPAPPRIFGFGTLYTDWGVLGNDRYGDCVFAGAAHETLVWNKYAGHSAAISTQNVLSDYAAVTGFTPDDLDSDQGTVVLDANKYRRSTGIIDVLGKRHKIAAYASIDPKDWDAMMSAAFTFGVVGIGFDCPETLFDQFENGDYWDIEDDNPDPPLVGGHYTPVVGSRNSKARATVVTWGRRQQMTRRYYEKYNDEAWVFLSEEQLRSDGTGLHGLDLDQLRADLAAL